MSGVSDWRFGLWLGSYLGLLVLIKVHLDIVVCYQWSGTRGISARGMCILFIC